MSSRLRRREVFKLAAAASTASLLSACFPPTSSPSAAPTATETPATAGKYPLGKIEGATLITDTSKYPKTFKEAPELAALVQQGKLPKVADRIGQDPIVLQPAQEIGKYGGTIHKALLNPATEGTIFRFAAGPSGFLWYDFKLQKIIPNIAAGYEISADGKVTTIHMRRGMKWSDGVDFTTDDVMFWYEDMYQNKSIVAAKLPGMTISGKDVTIEKVDQYTFRMVSPEANYLMPDLLASSNTFTGPANQGPLGQGLYACKHYLQKFHPKYAAGGQAALEKLAADNKIQGGWPAQFLQMNDWLLNPDLPVVTPWKGTNGITTGQVFKMERNPYSVWVDTDGNQLPYVGTLEHALVDNIDVLALRAIAGSYDFQDRHLDVTKLSLYLDGQTKGGYKLSLDPEEIGIGFALNHAYVDDQELGDLLRNVDFRRALSMGIDRSQVNEAFFLGTATPASMCIAETNKYFPGKEWRTKWATLDIAQANSLLDKLGYTSKDASGLRLRKDGKGTLRITFMAMNRLLDFAQVAEMIKQQWAKIGIDTFIDAVSTTIGSQRVTANQVQITGNQVGSDEPFLTTGFLTPGGGGFSALAGVPYALWKNSGGAQGKEPPDYIKAQWALYDKGLTQPEADRINTGKQLQQLATDNVFAIGVAGSDLANYGLRLAKTTLGNIPGRMTNARSQPSHIGHPVTFYFK